VRISIQEALSSGIITTSLAQEIQQKEKQGSLLKKKLRHHTKGYPICEHGLPFSPIEGHFPQEKLWMAILNHYKGSQTTVGIPCSSIRAI